MKEISGRLAFVFTALLFILGIVFSLSSCRDTYTPKPRSYFRIDFPKKEYSLFTSQCNYAFQYPAYGEVNEVDLSTKEPCWYNIYFEGYDATFYLTYKPLTGNLSSHIEDIRRIVYKHIIKADDILETRINIEERRVYGILYDIQGNAASSVNFYITDSLSGFLSGSLYFNVQTNKDSLAPSIKFFREDIIHLINTFSWE